MIKLGSHITFNGANKYLLGAVEESIQNKANCMMVYLGAPQNARRVDISNFNIEEYKEKYSEIIKPEDIVVHAPYIVNPASVEKHQFAIDFLVKEIERMNAIGAKYLVLHPGAHTKFTREEAIKTLVNSLKEILSKTKDVEISLETMAGKGTEIGTSFEELSYIIKEVGSDRVNICLDTCHVWEAGYDIRDFDLLINELKKNDLLELVKVIHVNDSKNELGAHKDRHENIGKGHIGIEPLKRIIHSKEFENTICVLETPWVENKPIYDKEIEILLKSV